MNVTEQRLRAALLPLADTIDPDEGPVIMAWGVPELARKLADRLAAEQTAAFPIAASCWCGPQPDTRAGPHERGGPDCRNRR